MMDREWEPWEPDWPRRPAIYGHPNDPDLDPLGEYERWAEEVDRLAIDQAFSRPPEPEDFQDAPLD